MIWRDEFFKGLLENEGSYPLQFIYNKQCLDKYFMDSKKDICVKPIDGGFLHTVTYMGKDGLYTIVELKMFNDYPAVDMTVSFKNTSSMDSGIIEMVHSTDLFFEDTIDKKFILHYANGAPSTPQDFIMHEKVIWPHDAAELGGAGGRSSNKDLPFFRLDTGRGAVVAGVGWSGQWKCRMWHNGQGLRFTYGLEQTHFRLHPGESVTMPSMTLLFWENAERDLCHSAFRRLVFDHYLPKIEGRNGDPYLFCNTCFTRFGGWLNECNEENQISLIKSLEPLNVESVIVDAGWFVGGWPEGAGNWDADPEKYPNGMATVAKAADECGMKYGLWFELERVVKNTDLEKNHPEWLLYNRSGVGGDWINNNMLLNMAIPEARAYALGIVEEYLKIPHFNAYRQDFNVDPLDYWKSADEPDRIGITELKYLSGLYEFLDAIRLNHPDCFMDGCSSGGRRIDMRMIRHFHTHQKTDFWFNNRVDQNSLYALSHYLPNVCITAHINRYDDYSMDSVMASTLCLGWIADGPDFPKSIALKQIKRYLEIRPLLNDQFFSLLPYHPSDDSIMAFQFHDRSLEAGAVFLFLREDNTGILPVVCLRGLCKESIYEVTCTNDGNVSRVSGAELMDCMKFDLPRHYRYSSVYKYRKI